MPTSALFHFIVDKADRTITVERSFHAPLDRVWAAWTEAELLCQWWAPKPYACVITALDLRPGGRWSYRMEGPEGDRHHCFFDYEKVEPKTCFSGRDGFCDEQGRINMDMPRMRWESRFAPHGSGTWVKVRIEFDTPEDLERIVTMGFREGFTTGLDQLEGLLTSGRS